MAAPERIGGDMTPEQINRIKNLESVKKDIQMTVYPEKMQEARTTILLALEDRQKAIFEGRV